MAHLEINHSRSEVLPVEAGPSVPLGPSSSTPVAKVKEPDLPSYSYHDSGVSILYATTSSQADDAAQLLSGS